MTTTVLSLPSRQGQRSCQPQQHGESECREGGGLCLDGHGPSGKSTGDATEVDALHSSYPAAAKEESKAAKRGDTGGNGG